jgi:glutamate-1-semialdehyde 2,1-aminomutase
VLEKTAYYMLESKSIKANNVGIYINRIGSMISVHFATPVVDLKLPQMETMKRLKILSWIIARRIYIAPSAYETWFITDAYLRIWFDSDH